MPRQTPRPRAVKLCDVHPRVHFCRSAMLVSLKHGLSRIVCCQNGMRTDLALDDALLVKANVESGTCKGFLHAGYADLMNDAQRTAARDALNADFKSLDASLPALSPLLGLFPSGTYLIADFDLFPVLRKDSRFEYFWDTPSYDYEILFLYYCGVSECYDAPLYLFPSERAAAMKPATLEAYADRLRAAPDSLRSVAFYLNGGVALLLDGHHKAAAAASLGLPARTLVIFAVDDGAGEIAKAVSGGERILLHHNSRYLSRSGPLQLAAADGRRLGDVFAMETMPPAKCHPVPEDKRYPLCPGQAGYREWWGRIPDAYRTNFERYPKADLLRDGTAIPPDQIRLAMAALRADRMPEMTERETHGRHFAFCIGPGRSIPENLRFFLRAYLELYPESKWLSESDRRYLQQDRDDPYWFPVQSEYISGV